MSYNHSLQYRTFDAVLADVANDFKKYQLRDLIDPSEMVKVVKRVNYDLGLRIQQTREVILEVEKGRVKMPNDFQTLNFALGAGKYDTKQSLPGGTHVEEKIIGSVEPEYQTAPNEKIDFCETPVVNSGNSNVCSQCGTSNVTDICDTCCSNPESCSLNCKGEVTQLVQVTSFETRVYNYLYPLKIKSNPREIDCESPNLYWNTNLTAYIKDGWLHTNFKTGKVYLNYQGMMEDEDGNLLAPDHDLLNEYYEYALKQRIIENLIMNDEEVNPNKIQLIESRFRAARNNAKSLVNTPNFEELSRLHKSNRKAFYNKYYSLFKTF
jgi:hypothetical protein